MGFIVPNAMELEVLTDILNTPWTLKLYSNNVTPAGSSATASFTEVTGGGYASKSLTFANWSITPGDSPIAVYNATQTWIFTGPTTGPGTIYGYYITRNSDSTLMLAERFSSILVPFSPITGSQIRILPRYSVLSQF